MEDVKRLIIKSKDRMWPTVIWQGTQLVVYYLGAEAEDVEVRETHGIDFEEFFLHLDRGGSVFVTMKPGAHLPPAKPGEVEVEPLDQTL